MPSPDATSAVNCRPKKKKACRRCRHRKQRCDFEQPCQNCVAAGQECIPVIQEPQQSYPVGYVSSLENHVATLERTLNERFPGATTDHLDFRSQIMHNPHNVGEGSSLDASFNTNPFLFDLGNSGNSPETDAAWQWQIPQTPALFSGPIDVPLPSGRRDTNHSGTPEYHNHSLMYASNFPSNLSTNRTSVQRPDGPEDIPTATAASFFKTYFQFIHPQYPFLCVKQCSEWYNEWKLAPPNAPIIGWPAYFVKMIFAIGSLIQSKSDTAPRYQHQDLKSQAQSEDTIIRSVSSSPLIRLQAMLLSAMHALHSESTARIAHLSGAIIRFASLHGFHRLIDLGDEASKLKTRVWSCAYTLDRSTSATLDVPVCLADTYISSSLYVDDHSEQGPMPWLNDLPSSDLPSTIPTLGTFAHICKIRLLQSYIIHTMQSVPLEGGATEEWQESMILQIDNWSKEIPSHILANSEGYQSPLWLGLIGQLSRLLLCRPSKSNINSQVSDVALQAGCDACTTFRALQKRRQIAQPWLVVVTQFQAGVTILYIIYARQIRASKEVDIAIRDCTSVLAILADRWQNAEHYRDCFEVLARAIVAGGSHGGGFIDADTRKELLDLAEKVNQAGVNRHVMTMLYEMAAGGEMDMEF